MSVSEFRVPLDNWFEGGLLLEVVHHQDLFGILTEIVLVVYNDASFHRES